MDQPRTTYRLNQFLSRCGVASRRKAEELIAEGKVLINGVKADHPGIQVDPEKDVVRVRGRTLKPAASQVFILYKPKGVMCTKSDPEGRKTIYDLLPHRTVRQGLNSVGRLDFESSGVIVLTTDGDIHGFLEHPSSNIARIYRVKARGILTEAQQQRLLKGVRLFDGIAKAEKIEAVELGPGISRFTLHLLEGRNREVRRMCEEVGVQVLDLKRIQYGPFELGPLPSGRWRPAFIEELKLLEKMRRSKARKK